MRPSLQRSDLPGATFDTNDVRSRRDREKMEAALREVEEIHRTELRQSLS